MKTKKKAEASSDKAQSVSGIYTLLSTAKKEIQKRWNDKELRKKAENFLEGDIPDFFKSSPKACLVRYIASPDMEFLRFIELAKISELEPICLEYLNDKLVTKNKDKYCLCSPASCFIEKNKQIIKKRGEIVNLTKWSGKSLKKVKTFSGEKLSDFHHNILNKFSCDFRFFDMSDWIKKKGEKPESFYKYFLSLFICHGILFENFVFRGKEKFFSNKNILPAIDELKSIFGVSPLIVPIIPDEEFNEIYWWCHPESLAEYLDR